MSALSHPTCLMHTWIFFFWKSTSPKCLILIFLTLICPPSHSLICLQTQPFPSVLLIFHWHLLFAALCGKKKKICAVNTVWHFLTFHELITLQIIKHVHICNKRRQNGCQRAWLMTSLRLDLMRFSLPWAGARCHCLQSCLQPFSSDHTDEMLEEKDGKINDYNEIFAFFQGWKKQWTRDVTTSIIWWC